jgi:WD40 repeat protein
MQGAGRAHREPDPRSASNQAEFRSLLRELMQWAGFGSLQQLEAAARRLGGAMPVSTADRALNADRLPTADFVRRFAAACQGDVDRWVAAREALADRRYARDRPALATAGGPSPGLAADADAAGTDICPYPGLAAFTTADAEWFFGRDRAISEVVRHLAQRNEGTGPLIVAAPSGAGKSSLLRAGLIPAVERGMLPGSRGWPRLLFTPTAQPINELAAHVAAHAGVEPQALADELTADPTRLAEVLHRELETRPRSHPTQTAKALIVVDQFEEIFTLCPEESQRRGFIRALCAATTRTGNQSPPVALAVLGLRADFYGRCAAYPELVEALRHGQVLLGAMRAAELRDAIEKPARAVGIDIESGLVEVMLADLGADADPKETDGHSYEPGALPLLSHALFATWRQREGQRLTLDSYRLAGGINGGIAATAEHAYGLLSPDEQRVARQLLLRMVQIGDGTDDTRRPLELARLADESTDSATTATVLDALTSARLIILDEKVVQITHEALLRAWPQMRAWIDGDRAKLLAHQRLADAAHAWDAEGRHPAGLHRGPRLSAVREWIDTDDPDLSPVVRDFLVSSIEAERDEQRAARRRTRRLRQLVALLTVLLLTATASVFYAVRAQRTTIEQRNIAIARKAAGDAVDMRFSNPALSTQLSLAAHRLAALPETRETLLSAFATPYTSRLVGSTGDVMSVAYTPDGHAMVSASRDGSARLWDVSDVHHPADLATLRLTEALIQAVFGQGGRLLATVGQTTVRLWDVTDLRHPRELTILPSPAGQVTRVAFSPDGRTMATAGGNGTAVLWDVAEPRRPNEITRLTAHTRGLSDVAFSPDGRVLATAGDRIARLWDVSDTRAPRELGVLAGHHDIVGAVAFASGGRTVATGSLDHDVRLWDVTNPRAPTAMATLTGATAFILSVAFSPDGRTLVTTGDGTRLWDVSDPRRPVSMINIPGGLYSATFNPDGRSVAIADADKTVRLLDLRDLPLVGHDNVVASLAVNPAGRVLATGSWDRTVRLWDVSDSRSRHPLATLRGHNGFVRMVAFSPDGRTLASASDDGRVWLWDVTDPAKPRKVTAIRSPDGEVVAVAYSPDGHWLATGEYQKVRLWDMSDRGNPRETASLGGYPSVVWAVTFSPDSRTLATGIRAGDVAARLWDIRDPHHPRELTFPFARSDTIPVGAFSPDNRTLASMSNINSNDNILRLTDVSKLDDPRPLATLTSYSGPFHDVAFSRDGRILAASHADKKVHLWNVADPSHPVKLATFTDYSDGVGAVMFGADGHTLVSVGGDFTVRLWETNVDSVAARVCEVAYPRITASEWGTYFPGLDYRPPCPE